MERLGQDIRLNAMERYSRQILLPEISIEGQEKLSKASVLIVGLGGLGCPVALYLTGAGVGRIGLCDNDAISISNLQRQILYSEDTEGRSKTIIAGKRLTELSSKTLFDLWKDGLNSYDAKEIISGYDLIIDCTDNFATRYLIDDTCHQLGKTWIHGAVEGFEGRVSTFSKNGMRYSELFPERDTLSVSPLATSGIIGPLPGIIGSLQAAEAIKLICGFGNTLAGKLLLFNLKEITLKILEL